MTMITRRTVLRLAGAVAAGPVLLGACTPRRPPAAAAPSASRPRPADKLLVETSRGLAIVDVSASRTLVEPRPGVVAYDGSSFATTAPAAGGEGTRVEILGFGGEPRYGTDIAGTFSARAVAPGGLRVALVAESGRAAADTYRPGGRRETTIVIVDGSGERHRLTVPGCVEPEAFADGREAMYALDYLPPLAPDRYRVRGLDLTTGRLAPLVTRDKRVIPSGAEEEMRGQGRQAVYSANRHMLFTLYTHQPDHEHTRDLVAARPGRPDVHAFVHSLSVDMGFAYCVDLPAPFGTGPVEGYAIALTPPGDDPVVVDGTSGTVARIDGELLTVLSTAEFPGAGGGTVSALLAEGGARLIVASGTAIHLLRTESLSTVRRWTLAAPARGMALTSDGARLWVGRPGGAVAYDMASGREVAMVPVPGLTAVAAATT